MTDYFNLNMPRESLLTLSSLGLAHLGDSVFEVMVRSWLCLQGKAKPRDLHRATVKYVAAPAQAAMVQKILPILESVRLSGELLDRFPSRLSGGQCQRMAIARGLLADPEVLFCDEITSALDVTAQREVVELLVELREALDLSIVFVSHDLALVHSFCDRILVLQGGSVVECGKASDVILHSEHPYTKQLLDSVLTV